MWNADPDFTRWKVPPPWHPSLPGQKQLFAHEERAMMEDSPVHQDSRRELFITGKDLPGAYETAQAILWDIE